MGAATDITIGRGLVSSYVQRRFMGYVVGCVHSVFEASLNVVVSGELVYIGSYSKGLSCLGFAIDDERISELVECVQKGDLVVIADEVLRIYTSVGVLGIQFRLFDSVSTAIEPYAVGFSPETLFPALSSLNLVRRLGLLLDDRMLGIASTCARLDITMDELGACIDYLIGRGLGLTPSGDDLLVGYGVARHLMRSERPFVKALTTRLSKASTTDVSLAYLKAISSGYANPIYLEMAEAASSRNEGRIAHALNAFLKVGHTSGADGLFGFALGIGLNLSASRPVAAYGGGTANR